MICTFTVTCYITASDEYHSFWHFVSESNIYEAFIFFYIFFEYTFTLCVTLRFSITVHFAPNHILYSKLSTYKGCQNMFLNAIEIALLRVRIPDWECVEPVLLWRCVQRNILKKNFDKCCSHWQNVKMNGTHQKL